MAVIDGDQLNIKRWIVFYPIYINSKKTIAEGRRINVSKACENPTCVEIGDCCKHLKLPCAIEVCYLTLTQCTFSSNLETLGSCSDDLMWEEL